MKTFIVFVVASFTFITGSSQAAQTANARMYCLSIAFNKANAGGPNALYSLELTGINESNNGEIYPVFGQSRTHFSTLIVTDDLFDDQFVGTMFLDVPTTDNDGDGFPDIFDTAKSLSGITTGTYNIPGFGSGNVTANWSRGAGAEVGNCQLSFQSRGTFAHSFTILEYKGPLTYTPGATNVSASVDLTLTGDANSKLKGPITFTKSPSDPYDELDFAEGVWTNSIPETFSFLSETLLRDATWPTNYYSFFEFDDWRLNTAEPDYYLWVISIDDTNDADTDGVPDFSDDPQTTTSRRPLLGLARAGSNLHLTVSGDIGQVCQIQQSSTIDGINWPTISSVTLTNDPQTVTLPLPSGTAFLRVHIP